MNAPHDLPPALLETNIPGFTKRSGKVRDVIDTGEGELVMVGTDRISTFDVVHPTGIPDKGKVLNRLSLFWFKKLKELIPDLQHHVVTSNVSAYGYGLDAYADQLEGRSMLVRKARPFPIECIARGYITGSGWKDYQNNGAICGIQLPKGLRKSQQFDQPIFTPSTKEETGHDKNITFEEMVDIVGEDVAERLRSMTLEIYGKAAAWAKQCGIIIADTKFEFGELPNGDCILIDEVLTPDSSRFWPADRYEVGRDQESFDKQFVRDYAQGLGWNKQPPAPALPEEIVRKTREKYIEGHDMLTGQRFTA